MSADLSNVKPPQTYSLLFPAAHFGHPYIHILVNLRYQYPMASQHKEMLGSGEDTGNTSMVKKHTNGTHRLTPKQYYQIMNAFCNPSIGESLYSNPNYVNLARFLRTPSKSRPATRSQFAWLYKIEPNRISNPIELQLPTSSNTWDEECHYNSIIFLTGCPSAEWLNSLGAYYEIDPEFYHSHLSFLPDSSIAGANLTQKAPPLLPPSAQRRVVQLKYVSIGKRETCNPVIEKEQQIANEAMQKYLLSLKKQDWKEGDSIVRSYSAHGACRFSIEQAITIYLSKSNVNPKFWIVMVWLDSGRDLSESPDGPWSSGSASFRHVSMYRPGIAFKNHKISQPERSYENPLRQSAWLLPRTYGKSLKMSEMSTDPFYALKEIFEFVVASELQLLERIECDLNTLLWDPEGNSSGAWSFESLRYTHHILELHICRNTETLYFIENRRKLGWPASQSDRAVSAENQLKIDYGFLVRKSMDLQRKCDKAREFLAYNAQQLSRTEKVQGPSISMICIGILGVFTAFSLASKYMLFPRATNPL